MKGLRASLAAGLVVALAGFTSAEDASAELSRAKQLLRGPGEGVVRQGAELCLKVGSADAMELVLDVLEAEQPHYRDIVWDVIPKFTDAYARQVVATRLKGANRSVRVKQWLAQALGAYAVSDFVGPLRTALGSPDVDLRAAAAYALGRIGDKSAAAALRERIKDDAPLVRADATAALARVSPADGRGALWEGLRDADPGVRCALLAIAPAIAADLAEEVSTEGLRDADWRVRLQAVDNFIALRTKNAVGAIVHASGDARPAVSRRMNAWLTEVTGMKFTERAQWQAWWKDNRETFAFPEKEKDKEKSDAKAPAPEEKRTFAAFNGLEVTSDHVVFVLDKSADMLQALKNGKVRDAAATAELDATLASLPAGVTFNVVTYGAKIQSAWKEPVVLDAKTRAAAMKFVASVPCAGSKDIWAALDTVVSGGMIDTVYLLSSGEPEVGLYVHWNRVVEHLALKNRRFKVVVHGVSYTSSKWCQDQIEHIALATGGKFIVRD